MGKLAAMPGLGAAPVSRAHPWLGSPAGPPGAGGGEVNRHGRRFPMCCMSESRGNLLTPAQISTPLKGLGTPPEDMALPRREGMNKL